jgi:hypothetical protein
MRTPSCRRTHATELLQAWSPICSQRFVILEDVRKLLVAEEIADAVRRTRPVLQDPGGDSLGDLVLEIALEDSGVLGDDGVGALLNLRSDVACQRIAHILKRRTLASPSFMPRPADIQNRVADAHEKVCPRSINTSPMSYVRREAWAGSRCHRAARGIRRRPRYRMQGSRSHPGSDAGARRCADC